MKKLYYFFRFFSEQKMATIIQVVATMTAICLLSIFYIFQNIKQFPIKPESNRQNFLISKFISWDYYQDDKVISSSNGLIPSCAYESIFSKLSSVKAIALFSAFPTQMPVPVSDMDNYMANVKYTNTDFFRVFDFDFIKGNYYNDSILDKCVISKSIALKCFSKVDCINQNLSIGYKNYKVCAVVEDVNPFAIYSCADIWLPYTALKKSNPELAGAYFPWNKMGCFFSIFLARKKTDFPKIIKEFKSHVDNFNDTSTIGLKMEFRDQPLDAECIGYKNQANQNADIDASRQQNFLFLLIIMIIPALNIGGITQSLWQTNVFEIGLRRAYGASKFDIFIRVIFRNFVITLISGIISLIPLIIILKYYSQDLFGIEFSNQNHNAFFTLNFGTFFYILLYCFLFNFIFSFITAVKSSKQNIVKALKNEE